MDRLRFALAAGSTAVAAVALAAPLEAAET